jgi:uncharacterized protein (DUF1684 family)
MSPLPLIAIMTIASADDDVVASARQWHEKRLQHLQADDGWLTLVGLGWLKEGVNRAGSGKDVDVEFPAEAPALVGTFTRSGSAVSFQPAAGVSILRLGQPFSGGALKTDAQAAGPDVLKVGRLSFYVIARGNELGVRIKDPDARARKEFKGIQTYPPSDSWRIRARWEPVTTPTTMEVPNVLGRIEAMNVPGTAVFSVTGKEYRLTPVLEEGVTQLFFIFADETNRRETYPAGRFLYADQPKDGYVVLDFNRAYNPPCAFSPFATCPLPPKQNRLALRVEAGEKRAGDH